MSLAYIITNKKYDSDDVPLTKMVLQSTTGVKNNNKYEEDDEENENYKNNITGKHKEIRQNKYVGMAEDLDNEEKIESKGKNFVIESLVYDSFISMEKRFNYSFILLVLYYPSIMILQYHYR